MKSRRISTRFLALFAPAYLAFIHAASSDLLWDNGSPQYVPRTDGFEITRWINADDFTLNAAARVESIQFGTIENNGLFVGSVAWFVYSNGSGNRPDVLLYSGVSNTVSHVPTGYVAGSEIEYTCNVVIEPISLPAGTYWLALHNGPLSVSINQRVYWQLAATSSARPSQTDEGPQFSGSWESNAVPAGTPAEVVFRLNGVFAPRISGVAFASGMPRVTFSTSAGRLYRVEYKDSLTNEWSAVSGAALVTGTGLPMQIPDTDPNIASVRRRFYRVVLL